MADNKIISEKTGKQSITRNEALIRALNKLTQSVRIYSDNNQLLLEAVGDFVAAVQSFGEDDEFLTIQMHKGRLFLQNEKILYRRESQNAIDNLVNYFDRLPLPGLRIQTSLVDIPNQQILAFVRLLATYEKQRNPLIWLTQKLEADEFYWVEVVQAPAEDEHHDPEFSERALREYSYALASIREVGEKIASSQRPGVRKAIRTAQNLVDMIMENDQVMLGLTTIRDYDDYTHSHSVNVAVLSMCLGQRIGLSRSSLERLGICGFFHDLGKISIPINILNKPGNLDEHEFREIQKHSLNSVRQIVKLRAAREIKAKILLPPFEHHLKYDLTGYPQTHRRKPISLFGRILTIADVFDAITSPRVYRPEALTPDQAFTLMLKGSGTDFDPVLLKVFIKMLGPIPIGTLLQLDDGRMGLVHETPSSGSSSRPRVMLLDHDGMGGRVRGEVIDLEEQDPDTGQYRVNIVKSLHPSTYGIQPAEFLF